MKSTRWKPSKAGQATCAPVDVIPQKLLPFKGTIAFADFAYISDWAYSSVMYLARAQIINGTGNDQFSPKKNATRAEAVVMIHRLLQNLI